MTTPAAGGSSLAAMISALAQVTAAQAEEGLSWNEIAERYGYPSGRQAKKIVHGLRVRVQRELAAIAARQASMSARGPYVHTFAPQEPAGEDGDGNPVYPEPGPSFTLTER